MGDQNLGILIAVRVKTACTVQLFHNILPKAENSFISAILPDIII